MPTHHISYDSRRSPVLATGGMVATSHPLAANAGLEILRQGGSAADAAVATAAVLNVVEPMSTGIGGDCFALYFDKATGQVTALNGSGRAPAALELDDLRAKGMKQIPDRSVHAVTVPGTARGWEDLLKRHGRMQLDAVLKAAIHYAEAGYPVSPIIAGSWQRLAGIFRQDDAPHDFLPDGRAPSAGEIVRLPAFAKTLRLIAEGGSPAFYEGDVANALVQQVQASGGYLDEADLKTHTSTWDEPISIDYHGVRVYECPPNGQGLAALLALKIVESFELEQMGPVDRLHTMIEAMRLGFADAQHYVADPAFAPAPLADLLSDRYANERGRLIQPSSAMQPPEFGRPLASSDTVYLTVVDTDGNACSFINSLYMGFGSGIVSRETGVVLQNRGALFSLDSAHPNCLAPGKRPYHTIIPVMATIGGQLFASFGVMGGFMQPQGHLQMLTALVNDGVGPQTALNLPRFCIEDGNPAGHIALEQGFGFDTMAALAKMGHRIVPVGNEDRGLFGGGQIIMRDQESGAYWGGSDPRKDGAAAAF